MQRNKTKLQEVVMKVIEFLAFLLMAPFMLLWAFGLPLLAITSLYLLFTIGGFEYLAGAFIFGIISVVIWDEPMEKISAFIRGRSQSKEEIAESGSMPKAPMTNPSQNRNTKDSKKEQMNSHKIPKGLHKCQRCGEYKGQGREKDLFPPDRLGYETKGGLGYFEVSCLCDGILCPKCKKNKIHRPISNYYDEESNSIWHVPHFVGQFGCAKCRKQNLPILYPKEIQELLKMRRIFEQKSKAEKALHKHSWSSAIIPPSPATRNNRETEVCFKCGQIGKKYDNT